MKRLFNSILFLIALLLLHGCNQPEQDAIQPLPDKGDTAVVKKGTALSISLIGYLEFNRSFSDIIFMDDEKEIDKYLRRQDKSNPLLHRNFSYTKKDTAIWQRLQELKLIKGIELLHYKFRQKNKANIQIDDPSGQKINVSFKGRDHTDMNVRVTAPDSGEIRYYATGGLTYKLMDVIPGGNKEIVLIDESYLANNSLFDLIVYEIKWNKSN